MSANPSSVPTGVSRPRVELLLGALDVTLRISALKTFKHAH
ncbi:MAG: hypothetical protein WA161_24085 [Pseudomonas sp.]